MREHLDLDAILSTYQEERGYPPYHPTMMTALLLYAYAQGVYSSRKIARSCEERIDFMAVTGMQKPDFRTVSDFRKRHLNALAGLFGQELKLCQEAGMVTLGHVALDGTKIKENASKHKAMSYGRMEAAEQALRQEVRAWMQRADEQDRDEDRRFGREKRGDELPDWVKNKQERIKRIQAAKQALEAEARAEAPADADDGKKKPHAKKRQKHGGVAATKDERLPTKWIRRMATKLRRGGWRSRYRLRKVTVEPVFGQIKEARGFRRFLLRGLEKVGAEWQLICAVHNLRKLAVVQG